VGMELIVDFNMRKPDGRLPALIPAGQAHDFFPGTKVQVTDGEGTHCLAVVSELKREGRLALLMPIGGTIRREDLVDAPAASIH
jgi:hypothetical protein